jgi:hypothetical protein
MELAEHRFDELSRLQYRIFTCALGGKHNARALVLKFSGVYGVGSAGNGDADFMRVIARVEGLPCALVVSDLCRGGFSTCQGFVPPMFDDIESAIHFVGQPARAALEQLLAGLDFGQ